MTLKHLNNISGVHIYSDGLEFPIAVYEKDSWDKVQISYLATTLHTTKSLIDWCRSHNID